MPKIDPSEKVRIDELEMEVARLKLQHERDALRIANHEEADDLAYDLDQLNAENVVLRAVLKEFANPDNWSQIQANGSWVWEGCEQIKGPAAFARRRLRGD